MTTKSDWVKVDYRANDLPKLKLGQKAKMRVHLRTSPYDVPEAFRLSEIRQGWLRIEFRYIDALGPASEFNLPNGALVEVERSTKRLVAIELNPNDHKVEEILSSFTSSIEQLSKQQEFKAQANWNYKAARTVVGQSGSCLADKLSALAFAH